jgi:hypothetical protein
MYYYMLLLPKELQFHFRALHAKCGRTARPGEDHKSTNLSVFSQAELDAIAARLNSRPRKTLGFATPDEVFAGLVDKAANAVTSRNAEGVRYGT